MTTGTETLEIREFSTKAEKNDGAPNSHADISVEITVKGRMPSNMTSHMNRIVQALADEYDTEADAPVRIRTADGTTLKESERV